MSALRTLIVDDESLARRGLRLRLQQFEGIEIVAECANGRAALTALAEQPVDLLFLDIQMPGMDGFEVVRRLPPDATPLVVFVTAFDHYAVEAFEVHAVDYVLKPVDEERLGLAVERVRARHAERGAVGDKQRLLELVGGITGQVPGELEQIANGAPTPATRLVIRDGSAIHRVPFDDIEWVDAAGDYMCIHAAGTTHVTRATMKELEASLDPRRFARIHRSTLVNIERVRSVRPLENGKYQVWLDGGQKLVMSRSYRDQISQFL